MALIKYGGGVIGASGSVGGTTFARNRFGNYKRSRTKPVNPKSEGQNLIRSALAYLSQYWSANLNDEQRGGWNTYAAAVPFLNRLGEQVFLTGFNMFLRSNIIRIQANLALVLNGPTVLTLPEQDPTMDFTATASNQQLNLTFDQNLPWAEEAEGGLHVYMGQPQNPTRNFFNGPWKYAGTIQEPTGGMATLMAPFTIVEGQKIWVQARIQREDGRLSGLFRSIALGWAGP